MSCGKYYWSILLFILLAAVRTNAQEDAFGNFLKELNNKNATTTLALVAPQKTFDSTDHKINIHTVERRLTSVNVYTLEKTYSRKMMIKRLLPLLNDPDRDWYANLLLYALTGRSTLPIVNIDNRDKWIAPVKGSTRSRKDEDVAMWQHSFPPAAPN